MQAISAPDVEKIPRTHTALGLPDWRAKGILLVSAPRMLCDQKDQNNQYDRIISNIPAIL
jgi:hypothetical protein